MLTKTSLKVVIALGTVALILLVLGVFFVPRGLAGNKANADNAARLAEANVLQRLPSNYYINSDWSERHPASVNFGSTLDQSSNYYFKSDWIERHPSNYYAGSDWIERHPVPSLPANYYIGSDWIERHPIPSLPANYYAGSDWIERHPIPSLPSNYFAGSDWIERHPAEPEK